MLNHCHEIHQYENGIIKNIANMDIIKLSYYSYPSFNYKIIPKDINSISYLEKEHNRNNKKSYHSILNY